MSKGKKTDELLDVNQVAKRLCISRSSVYRLIHIGEIPAARFGPVNGLRAMASDVERYREKREQEVKVNK